MKLLSRCNVSRENNGPRKFTIELTMSGLLSLGVVVVLGMCWVFILGILLGRGYRPESAVPQLAQMMPTTQTVVPEEKPSDPPKILKPEDLTFMDRVSDGAVVTSSTLRGQAELKKIPVTAQANAHKSEATRTTRQAVEPRSHDEARQPSTKQATYRATYQIASFPAKDQAQTMVNRLAGKGIKATVHGVTINNRKYFRVYVQLRGTAADIAKGLKKTGEKGPILLDKKPL